MKKKQSLWIYPLDNETGSTLVMALMVLVVVTILGIFSINTSTTELTIARNDRLYTMAFYASEAARGYVPPHTGLYGENNITQGSSLSFASGTPGDFSLNTNNSSFNGTVGYTGFSQAPRGSGYEVSKFRAHRYEMTCNGYDGSGNSEIIIQSGFYRIGF
jgi:Tfp pilus assembly protein PilX